MISVVERAEALGFRGVRADTTAGNAAAVGILRALGFDLTPNADGVDALLLFAKDWLASIWSWSQALRRLY